MHSTVAFTSTILGAVHVRGRFTDYDASIVYDPKHVERSSVSAIIKATSINTDMDFRDDHLRSPDFLDVKQFPTIAFTSERVVVTGSGLTVFGTLSMHGVSRRVVVPARLLLAPHLTGDVVNIAFSAAVKVSRKDFGIAGTNAFNPSYNPATNMLSDTIAILLEVDAMQQRYANRKLGTGTPPGVADTIDRVLRARGIDAALDAYRQLAAAQSPAFRFSAGQLDLVGRQLAERGRLKEAVRILELNAERYGDSPGVLESLAEVQAMANDTASALATYRLALAKFPDSATAREMIRHLERP